MKTLEAFEYNPLKHTMSEYVDDHLQSYFIDGPAAELDHWDIVNDLLEDAYSFRVNFGCYPGDEWQRIGY